MLPVRDLLIVGTPSMSVGSGMEGDVDILLLIVSPNCSTF